MIIDMETTSKHTTQLSRKERIGSATGFTLMELLVVVGIIGILLAVATPNIIAWLPNLRLKSDARNLVSNLQKARLEAIKRNQCVGVKFTPVALPATRGGYAIFLDNGAGLNSCNGVRDVDETSMPPGLPAGQLSVTMSQSVSLTSAALVGINPDSFSFSPKGVVHSSQYGTVQLQNTNGLSYLVTVSAAGNIRLQIQ